MVKGMVKLWSADGVVTIAFVFRYLKAMVGDHAFTMALTIP